MELEIALIAIDATC